MKVILKESISSLGKPGDIVKVNDGYARNFLIPTGKAVPATDSNIKSLQEYLKKKQEIKKEQDENLSKILEKLKNVEITITKKVAQDNKLFGSVSEIEIVDELKKIGIEIEKNNVILKKHIKETGVFSVPIILKAGFETNVKVKVNGEN